MVEKERRNLDVAVMTSEDALRFSIRLAVAAGEYERAVALLDVAKRTTKPASVTPTRRPRCGTSRTEHPPPPPRVR